MPAKIAGRLATVESQLRRLEERHRELEQAIVRLRRIAVWLRARRPKGVPVKAEARSRSLTDGCRAALQISAPAGATPLEVRHTLTESGLNWDRFSSPMSAIHTTLKRLVSQNEAVASIDREGQRRYRTKRTVPVALTRREVEDDVFVKKLLEAESPEEIAFVLEQRRRGS